MRKNRFKCSATIGIPDLEHSKAGVLRSLGSPDSRRGYQHAIDEFVPWYCSEPRLALNKTVVLRYRFHLEERGLAAGDDQRANGCCATAGVRGGRLRPFEPRIGCRDPPCQRCSQTGLSFRQLAYGGLRRRHSGNYPMAKLLRKSVIEPFWPSYSVADSVAANLQN
jgi:hypothetical protein